MAHVDENGIIKNEILLHNLAGYLRLMYPEQTDEYIAHLLFFTKKSNLIKLIEDYVPPSSLPQGPRIQIEAPK